VINLKLQLAQSHQRSQPPGATDRQTDRQTFRERERQRQTVTERYKQQHRQTDRLTSCRSPSNSSITADWHYTTTTTKTTTTTIKTTTTTTTTTLQLRRFHPKTNIRFSSLPLPCNPLPLNLPHVYFLFPPPFPVKWLLKCHQGILGAL